MSEKETVLKKALSDFLGFLKYKVDNDLLTMEEAQSFKDAIDSSLPVRGTVKDLAGYFGQSEDNIRHIIHRNLMPKPKRRVYFDFRAFDRFVPEKWRSQTPGSGNPG